MSGGGRESTTLQITGVASDSVLARVVDVLYVERVDPVRLVVDRVNCTGLVSSDRT